MTLLLLFLAARPLAPFPFTACFVENPAEADMVARQVTTTAEADWCIKPIKNCKKANLLIKRDQSSTTSYVVSEACR